MDGPLRKCMIHIIIFQNICALLDKKDRLKNVFIYSGYGELILKFKLYY